MGISRELALLRAEAEYKCADNKEQLWLGIREMLKTLPEEENVIKGLDKFKKDDIIE